MRVALPMLLALAPLAGAAQVAPAPRDGLALPSPDWSTLPQLRFQRPLPSMAPLSVWVRGEVDAGHCASVARSVSSAVVRVDLAVLVGADSRIRRIVPRAIDCVSVEQYAAGLISKLARDNVDTMLIERDTWFRTTLIFAWPT